MSRLRIALPPLDQLTSHTALQFARLDHSGRVSQTGVSTLLLLGQESSSPALECFLHPVDSVLTSLPLPPLSAVKIAAAVACAAQALILGGSAHMHVAHSARDGNGQVYLAWLPKAVLARFGELLNLHHLKLRGLYPAPFALPVPPTGQISASVLDEQLLLRLSSEQASVEPLVQERLEVLLANGSAVQWIGDDTPAAVLEQRPADQRWSGAAPGWGLHGGVGKPAGPTPGWGRAAICCALAVAVWVFGLNLYAAREASQGQQLKAQMSQRVKQAFPELPVILNPLQQARQQLAARQSGAATDTHDGFAYLVQHAASTMSFMAGTVQRLTFDQGRLQLELAADTTHSTADGAMTGALDQAGLTAVREGNVWTLSSQVEPASADSGASMDNDDE
ncbi:type II secretion system protein GspL [Pseudomonas sp. TH43]|uniref:type II secretion system protein GspL n=1 Tax=Pseudomonas sp. TH43 TaxID=2796407 RepID=UPI00191277E5|nr:type II secretion system protein GspL [Pseudomonas sp. TH43]MBK5374890.1 type II secretion system protein GspL [Pseudomonas sp. TH43]